MIALNAGAAIYIAGLAKTTKGVDMALDGFRFSCWQDVGAG